MTGTKEVGMTLKEFADALQISRNVAARLAQKIAGATREARAPGQIPAWLLPDDAVDQVTEDMLEAAKAEAGRGDTLPASVVSQSSSVDLALLEEERAVRRERLATERARAESERLRAEAERHKAEEELQRLRGRERISRPDPDGLADRLSSLERKIEQATRPPDGIAALAEVLLKRPDATATLGEILKTLTPVLAPVFERLASPPPAPPQPGPPPFGPEQLLGLAEKLKGLIVSSPEAADFREEIRRAYRDGLDDGRERAAASSGEGGAGTLEVIRGLAEAIPQAIRSFGEIRGQAGPIGPQLPRALPTGGEQGGGATMATNTVFAEILTELATELAKPAPAIAGVAAFMDAIIMNPTTGETMLDLLDKLSQAPERLALAGLRAWAPSLTEPAVLPGVRALLAHLREEAARAAEAETEGGGQRA